MPWARYAIRISPIFCCAVWAAVFRSFTPSGTPNRDARVTLAYRKYGSYPERSSRNGCVSATRHFAGFPSTLSPRRQEADVDETAASVDENLLEGEMLGTNIIHRLAGVLWA